MDHAIEHLREYAESTAWSYDIKEQLAEGKKITECIGYEELRAYVKALNALHEYIGWEKIKVIDLVEKGE